MQAHGKKRILITVCAGAKKLGSIEVARIMGCNGAREGKGEGFPTKY
jgi:hypothetical protein